MFPISGAIQNPSTGGGGGGGTTTPTPPPPTPSGEWETRLTGVETAVGTINGHISNLVGSVGTLNGHIVTLVGSVNSLSDGLVAANARIDAVGTPASTSASTIQGWIRGSGLFRRCLALMDHTDVNDSHWQSFLLVPYLSGSPLGINVYPPSAELAGSMTPYTPFSELQNNWNGTINPPCGAWTLIMNVANTAQVTIHFPQQMSNVVGYNAVTGQSISTTGTPTYTLPQNRMALLVYIGSNRNYWLYIW